MIPLPAPAEISLWLGGNVDLRVEVDVGGTAGLWGIGEWGIDTWGSSDPDWVDVTEFVLGVHTQRGAAGWGQRFDTGTAAIELQNTDGRFTPNSGIEPYHKTFRPGRWLRVVAIPDQISGTPVPLFTGFIEGARDSYGSGGFDIVTTLTVQDFMALWSLHNPAAMGTATGVQATDERVEAALDRMDWPAGLRDLQLGAHEMQTSHLAQSTLEECGRAADAEGGAFYCAEDGAATFKARDWLITDARSVNIQGYVGYETIPAAAIGAWVESERIVPSWERSRVVNAAEYARVGSSMQIANDTTSQVLYGVRTDTRTDLENSSDADVLFLAERVVAAFSTLRGRLDQITITGVADPDDDDLNRLMWGTQIGDRLSVLVEPPYGWSYEREVHVMGVSHEITGDLWETTFRLDDAQTFEP